MQTYKDNVTFSLLLENINSESQKVICLHIRFLNCDISLFDAIYFFICLS